MVARVGHLCDHNLYIPYCTFLVITKRRDFVGSKLHLGPEVRLQIKPFSVS